MWTEPSPAKKLVCIPVLTICVTGAWRAEHFSTLLSILAHKSNDLFTPEAHAGTFDVGRMRMQFIWEKILR